MLGKYTKTKNGCWEWNGAMSHQGYGKIKRKGKYLQAHRVSYEFFVDDIPKGMQINHRCHNRKCVNPYHLYVGTHNDNMRDMVVSGRSLDQYGEKNHNSKLTKDNVVKIKTLLKEGRKQNSLAKEFGVTISTIHLIKKGLTWAGV